MKAGSVCVLVIFALMAASAFADTFAGETPYVLVDGRRIPTNTTDALFTYVNAYDSHFSYYDTNQRLYGEGWTGYILNMTSQQWLTSNDTSRSVWTHHLVVIQPDVVKNGTNAILYITGGSNKQSPPTKDDADIYVISQVAMATGTIGAALYQVPNQPTEFFDDPTHNTGRSEDSLVGYTWRHIADNPLRPDWAAYLPMTKASVRAMDVISDFTRKQGIAFVDYFFVLGASKRGATTWLVGAYDGWLPPSKRRVIGIAPIVFDMLKLPLGVNHMYEALGGWTFAFVDYRDNNVTELINTPKMQLIADVCDPITYVKYLTMPKLVITATGDEFFMPDDNWSWWQDMTEEKHLLMIENAEHSMITGLSKLVAGATSFYASLMAGSPRPKYTWEINQQTGALDLWSSHKPAEVVLHQAETVPNTPNRRDFRMIKGYSPTVPCPSPAFVVGKVCVNPIVWESTTVEPVEVENGIYHYKAELAVPESGNWLGFYFEMRDPAPMNQTFHTTTQVSIIPNTLPFEPCGSGESCYGDLV